MQGRAQGDGPKVTDPNLRFLWFSAKIFGFLARIRDFLQFPAPSTCLIFLVNLRLELPLSLYTTLGPSL